MKPLTLAGLAIGLFALVAAGTRIDGQAVGATPGQAPSAIVNAHLTTRSGAGDLYRAFQSIVSGQQQPAWIGYRVPATPGEHHSCDYMNGMPTRSYLEGRPRTEDRTEGAKRVELESSRPLLVLYRVNQAKVHKVRIFSEDCEIDAGGLPVFWLTDVNPDQSVSLLAGFVRSAPEPEARRSRNADTELSPDGAMTALALHATPAATRALTEFVGTKQPLNIRKRAAFWLGAARGREGFEVLRRMADATGDDAAFRKELVFPVSISHEPEAVDILLRMAKNDSSHEVRQQALFWVGQKAGAKAASFLSDVVRNDPDTELKKRAVFSLSQLPKDEGVPRLIDVARTNSNAEVRKQAMFWLGQSGDARAIAFFEEVLKK